MCSSPQFALILLANLVRAWSWCGVYKPTAKQSSRPTTQRSGIDILMVVTVAGYTAGTLLGSMPATNLLNTHGAREILSRKYPAIARHTASTTINRLPTYQE